MCSKAIVCAGEGKSRVALFGVMNPSVSKFFTAIDSGDTATLNACLDENVELINKLHPLDGLSGTHAAVIASKLESLKVLVKRGADVNIQSRGNDGSPLHKAAWWVFFATVGATSI
jgi:hypothetical protein